MNALLLAAGEGTRLRPLTERLPKPMIPIGGKPILEHNVQWLARHGICNIAINLHHHPDAIRNHFGDGSRFKVHITYSYEPDLLGTAGAVKKLEPFLQGTFLVIYGDNLIDCDLNRLVAFHRHHRGMATIGLHYREDISQSGVVSLDGEDRVVQFVEKPKESQGLSHWVNAGVLAMEEEVLGHIPVGVASDFGREILPQLLDLGKPLYGYRLRDGEQIWWIDRMEDYERVEKIFGNRNTKNQ